MSLSRPRTSAAAGVSLALAAAAVLAAPLPALGSAPAIGQRAPSLVVPELDGHEFDLAKLRGKVVLVNFWATWCSPCRVEMPTLNAFYHRYRSRGLDVLGLSIDEAPDAARVRQVMRQFSYPGALASAARVNGFGEPIAVPVTYVIDARGVVRAQLQAEGPSGVSRQALEQAVLPLLPDRKGVSRSTRDRVGGSHRVSGAPGGK